MHVGFSEISKLHNLKSLKLWHIDTITNSRIDFVRMFNDKNLENLTHLDISRIRALNSPMLRIIALNCPKLECLLLNNCNLNDEKLSIVIENCNRIKMLQLEDEDELTDGAFQNIHEHLPLLRHLWLSKNKIYF